MIEDIELLPIDLTVTPDDMSKTTTLMSHLEAYLDSYFIETAIVMCILTVLIVVLNNITVRKRIKDAYRARQKREEIVSEDQH